MSKELKEKQTATTATTEEHIIRVANGEDIRALMEKYPNVSLRRLSQVLNVNYGAILKGSKAPIVGQPYNPEDTNWDQIATEFAKRNANFLEDNTTFDWTELNAQSSKVTVGVQKSLDEFNVGDKVYIRKHPTTPYIIVWKTSTHIVIQLEGTTEPQCWAHGTLLLNGPTKTPRTVAVVDETGGVQLMHCDGSMYIPKAVKVDEEK